MREARRSKGVDFTDVLLLRTPEFAIGLAGFCGAVLLTSISGWFVLALLGWCVLYGWWLWTLMRNAEACIDDDGIVERGVFFGRRFLWAEAAELPDSEHDRTPRAVLLGHTMIQGRGIRTPVLVVCCAGRPYPRPLRCTRNGAMSNVLATLAELAEAGYPVEYNTQSPLVWAADPRRGLTPRDGRWPWRLRHRLRRPLR